jgi:hypothetical protein
MILTHTGGPPVCLWVLRREKQSRQKNKKKEENIPPTYVQKLTISIPLPLYMTRQISENARDSQPARYGRQSVYSMSS